MINGKPTVKYSTMEAVTLWLVEYAVELITKKDYDVLNCDSWHTIEISYFQLQVCAKNLRIFLLVTEWAGFRVAATCHCLYISLHIDKPPLPLGAEGLQRAFNLPQSPARSLTLFHPISLSFKIIGIPSSEVCHGLPLGLLPRVLACQAILGYL